MGCEAVSTETSVGPATVVRLVENADMMVAAQRIARRLSLSGFFGLDFVIEEGYRRSVSHRNESQMHSALSFAAWGRARHGWRALCATDGKTTERAGVDYSKQSDRLLSGSFAQKQRILAVELS